jgi:hypothetical protein
MPGPAVSIAHPGGSGIRGRAGHWPESGPAQMAIRHRTEAFLRFRVRSALTLTKIIRGIPNAICALPSIDLLKEANHIGHFTRLTRAVVSTMVDDLGNNTFPRVPLARCEGPALSSRPLPKSAACCKSGAKSKRMACLPINFRSTRNGVL